MLSYPAKITVSNHALLTRPDALRQRRHQVGTRWRRLSVGRQALLALAHLRKGETYADLAAGFGIGTTTVFRYIREALEVLAALAPSLADWRAFVPAPVPYDQGVAREPACLALVVMGSRSSRAIGSTFAAIDSLELSSRFHQLGVVRMIDRRGADEPEEVLVPIGEALPGMQIVSLPDGQTWVGALILVKTQDDRGELRWSMRRTEGLSDEELLGIVAVGAEMFRDRIRFRE